jgi:quercetin 2,3-dioxygenase
MITLRPSKARGHANHGWLDSFHTFSFANYYDPKNNGFRSLRVINEDRIAPSSGFGTHPHNDMEIVTYVVEGELAHRDSMGNTAVLRSGDVQAMTAGSGLTHSEFNASKTDPVHMLQIWIRPRERSLAPGYADRTFHVRDEPNRLHRLTRSADVPANAAGAPDSANAAGAADAAGAGDGALPIHQDAELYAAVLTPGQSLTHTLRNGGHAWVQVVRGTLNVNGATLQPGDGAAVSEEEKLSLQSESGAEFLLFDLA